VAIVTPFKNDKSIDFEGIKRLVEHLVTNGVDYLVLQGTTGESVTLTKEEKIAVLNAVIETVDLRIPLVLGLGGNNTQLILDSFDSFDFRNIAGILSVSPYYNKPTQEGIYQHYKAIGEASPVPVVLYNVPGRTGSNITAETTLRLAHDIPGIVAIKEASGDLDQIGKIIKERPESFLVISGDDALTLPIIALGGDGVISVTANAFPKEFSNLVNEALSGNYKRAREIHYELTDIIKLLFTEGNPGGVKAALKILNICEDYLRLPLVNVGSSLYEELKKAISSRLEAYAV